MKEIKKGTIKTLFPKSVTSVYSHPHINPVVIEADDPKFVPTINNDTGMMVLKAKDAATLPHRATVALDCGFSVEIKPGWKIVANGLTHWLEKGLIVTSPTLSSSGRVKVYLTNVGKEIIAIKPDDEIAQINVEPLYVFNWMGE